ncbi:to exosomal core protein CSL4 [Geosmithia morbida]|uniref:To exosomal core protein CSL4 n=1 Tax=Geosmithia morbida TaxID=1094350 RepID=A0A9P4YP36_9HYPO|nr:to exosomal core protein CSL4 [Geosmithia morbida]KAF4120531.1 to exosomal core protein CSL4 [Geosmithia morbida]
MSSTTMILTMADTAVTAKGGLPTSTTTGNDLCPSCGSSLPDLIQAQARIAELEAQVGQLNDKAEAAVGRWAEYEDELARLRAQAAPTTASANPNDSSSSSDSSSSDPTPPPPPPKDDDRTPSTPAAEDRRSSTGFLQGRLSSLLGSRSNKSSPSLERYGRAESDHQSAEQLLQALVREQSLRKEAEGRLTATSKEVEELSASLFEQANEMVAEERRARAKLEERVSELERRDSDKRRRLETLESAMARIDSARQLLAQHEQHDNEARQQQQQQESEKEQDAESGPPKE